MAELWTKTKIYIHGNVKLMIFVKERIGNGRKGKYIKRGEGCAAAHDLW